ncbi:Glycoprotein [Entamoeba marina]
MFLLLCSYLCSVGFAHYSEFIILPSSPSIHIKYDVQTSQVTSETSTTFVHFNTDFPLPSHLIPHSPIDTIQVSIKKPHQLGYNYFNIREYTSPISSNTFTIKGLFYSTSQIDQVFHGLFGKSFNDYGCYNSSIYDPFYQQLNSVNFSDSSCANEYYHIESEGQQGFDEDFSIVESIFSNNRTLRNEKNQYAPLYNYLSKHLEQVRKEWDLKQSLLPQRIQQRIVIDFNNKFVNYSEVNVVFTGEIDLKTPSISDDHNRTLTYLSSCGTDISTKERVCKFTRHRPSNKNGQIITIPHVQRQKPKASYLQHLIRPNNKYHSNFTLSISTGFMNATYDQCEVYYVYDFPKEIFFTELDKKRLSQQHIELINITNTTTTQFVLFKTVKNTIINNFKIHFHVHSSSNPISFTISIPYVFQSCDKNCGDYYSLEELLNLNKRNIKIFDIRDTSSISPLLFGCSGSDISQLFDPYCSKQIVTIVPPSKKSILDDFMPFKKPLIIFTTSVIGITILLVSIILLM